MQKNQYPILFTVVIMAVITAVGLFLAWSYISRRDDPPDYSYTVIVEDTEIVVVSNPADRVRLVVPSSDQSQPEVQPDGQTTEPEPDQPAADTPSPTETPVPPEPTATPRPDPVIFIDYLVQANDTMYGLTVHHATSIALMAQEGIAQDNLIPGQTIRLPIGNPDYCPGRRPYAVAEGDTVFNISRTLGVSLADLKAINELNDNYDIKAAQILCVP
jgi:LysM repeat protein